MLYLIEILHQTTTLNAISLLRFRCILSKFYIKPQPPGMCSSMPTRCILSKFYIKPQQAVGQSDESFRCILSKFYIKPQHD